MYALAKQKIRPPAPEPVRVGTNFQPKNYSPGAFNWVNEENVADKLSEGYSYYRDPEDGATRFMIPNPSQAQPDKAFFMLRPSEEKTKDVD